MKDLKRLFKYYRRIRKMKKGVKSIRKNWKKIIASINSIKKALFNKK